MNPYFNENTVLDYVKLHLGYPFNIIEFDDNFLINEIICSNNYLKEFSQYFPKEERIELNDSNNLDTMEINTAKPGNYKGIYNNRWKLHSENEILAVQKVIRSAFGGNAILYGDAPVYQNPIGFSTDNFLLSMTEPRITFRFYYPDILEVYGMARTHTMMAVLSTVHDKDLSSIPSSLHMSYNRFCLYTAANFILAIRYKYETMETPFGQISLNIQWIQDLANKKTELIQEFRHPGNWNSRGAGILVI